MRTAIACLTAVFAASAVLAADDHCVLTDDDLDYAQFKTFTAAVPRITSERPELNFPALLQTLTETINKTMLATGLKETRAAQLTVEAAISTVDYELGSFGRANVVNRGRTGPGGRQSSQVDFSEATLVIDLKREVTHALVWRGV